jgi:lipopolysaccharide/colanic/teichoic acid biosynthesis glycosyltransferase
MMIAGQEPSVSHGSAPFDDDAATASSTASLAAVIGSPDAEDRPSRTVGRPCKWSAATTLDPAWAEAFGARALPPSIDATAPPSPIGATTVRPRRARRIRKAPDRVVSRIDARLAAGQEIVGFEGNGSPWYARAKRAVDVVGAGALLCVFSPILLATYLVLLLTTRGRPIFCQQRLGQGGRPFTMYKFRTMQPDADQRQHTVRNEQDGPIFKNRCDPRVTRVGRFLRSTSIDEMPQLVNVLLGQMSLVGPRPPLKREVAQYRPWQRRRLTVKPGLTCLWQVSGRSQIGFEQWVRMDLWYVRNQGLLTDLRLLARTPWSVLSRRGAY